MHALVVKLKSDSSVQPFPEHLCYIVEPPRPLIFLHSFEMPRFC